MDRKDCVRPARRTALIGLELQRYNIDIAALSETRLADTGSITEVGAGYTFFWSGKAADERREAGVGFAIRTSLVRHLESLPKGINDRLMMLRLPLKGKTNLTLISAYAPTMCYQEQKLPGTERTVLPEPHTASTFGPQGRQTPATRRLQRPSCEGLPVMA